ncbi:MAG: hypothetical protein PHD67_07985 [Oscillospiraceae bacterium]|nr:hypothetical protein [Oscillospiraceae bacterium]
MQNILDELYNQYCRTTPQPQAQKEIEECHQTLIRSLVKPERKLVLRIIDNKDFIAGARARESFACGFWLAWRLFSQLHSYDSGRSHGEDPSVGDRFVISNRESENEQGI